MKNRISRSLMLALTLGFVVAAGVPSTSVTFAAEGETCPNEKLRQESNLNQQTGVRYSAELPDCRAYEVVTPVEKGQANILSEGAGGNGQKPFQQAAANGEGIMYGIEDALPGDQSGPLFGKEVAFPGPTGWLTTSLAGPQLILEREGSWVNVFAHFSSNLTCATDETEEPMERLSSNVIAPLPAGETLGEVINLYVWSKEANSYRLVSNTNPANRLSIGFSLPYQIYGATEDCSSVVFATEYRLLPEAPANGNSLYEWHNGALRLLSRRPDGTATAVLNGTSGHSIVGAVSGSGLRTFFTGTSDSGADSGKTEVFLREGESTVEVSQSQTATPDSEATFQAAAGDGSQVLFIANHGLTASSSSVGSDLYDYNVETKALTDLSADTNASDTEGAAVQGVLGVAQDASYVYFAALGQLPASNSTGSRTEAEDKARKEVNVYAWHNGQLGYVANIGSGESTDYLSQSQFLASRVNPGGSALLFTSALKLTAFENTTSGGTKESELYLYTSSSHSVVCVSCDPNNARAIGPAVTTYPGFNNGYAPRNLNDEGSRVFFTSEDPLTPGAPSGSGAYEWEREGVGSCTESASHGVAQYSGGCIYLLAAHGSVLDASSTGGDVFVTTSLSLVPQDPDGLVDVYDVKVDGGFPAPSQAVCSGEECQGELNGALSFSVPGSTGAPAVGNAPPWVEAKTVPKSVKRTTLTRTQKLSNALKACRKQARKKRAVCESRARKQYGAKAKGRSRAKDKTKKSSGKGGK